MKKASKKSFLSSTLCGLSLMGGLSGCATAQENRFAMAGASALIGAASLPALAPANEDKSQQSSLGFFAGAALGFAIGNLLFNDEPAAQEVRQQNLELKKQIQFLEQAKRWRIQPQKDPQNTKLKKTHLGLKIAPLPSENQARVYDEVYEITHEK